MCSSVYFDGTLIIGRQAFHPVPAVRADPLADIHRPEINIRLCIIKIIDRIWAAHIGDPDRVLYLTLPHSFDYMWPVYLLLGIGVPLLGYQLVQKIKNRGK